MKEHTPGPWDEMVIGRDNQFIEIENKDQSICTVLNFDTDENMFANACLIAAAPDLLAACEAIDAELMHLEASDLALFYQIEDEMADVIIKMRQAIAKARGETST